MNNPYDDVLYEGFPFDQTHPDRLATIARLFGMNPAPVDRCRMLELGCGDGGNLIPMAYTLPGSAFVGIDAGACGIAKGCELARDLGIRNVDLQCLDIRDASRLGPFDYIVAHGVYSWTPSDVQAQILSVCRELLRPQGVAYVSYTVYPGAHVKTMIAEMLKYHARRFENPLEQIEQARGMLAFLAGARAGNDPYSLLLQQEVEVMLARRPASIYHDELASHHEPLYFREFAARAARTGLQYLGEADFHEMQDCSQSPETVALLHRLAGDLIEREQHLDFLKCRRFRQTLLCHEEVRLDRRLRSGQVREFRVAAARLRDDSEPDRPITEHPLAAAANDVLQDAWPIALTFGELLAAVRGRIGSTTDDESLLEDLVLAHYAVGRFQLRTSPPAFARHSGERPRCSALARFQASSSPFVTNLNHRPVKLEGEISRALLAAMDGTRDRSSLLAAVREAPGAGGASPEDLDRSIDQLARLALLEA